MGFPDWLPLLVTFPRSCPLRLRTRSLTWLFPSATLIIVQETHQRMRYANVTSLYVAIHLAFNAPTEGFPLDDLSKTLHGGQRMVKVHSGEEISPKVSTP